MCESLQTTSEVTDDQEKSITSFNKKNSWNRVGLLCTDGGSSMSVKSGFTILVNKRAPYIMSAPCVLHRHTLAGKALPEYLKIVLKHVTERIHFIRAQARLFKPLIKIN